MNDLYSLVGVHAVFYEKGGEVRQWVIDELDHTSPHWENITNEDHFDKQLAANVPRDERTEILDEPMVGLTVSETDELLAWEREELGADTYDRAWNDLVKFAQQIRDDEEKELIESESVITRVYSVTFMALLKVKMGWEGVEDITAVGIVNTSKLAELAKDNLAQFAENRS